MKKAKTPLNPRTARRWRAAGTNPSDPKQRRDRLLESKHAPEGLIAGAPAEDHPVPLAGGLDEQAKRLERDVATLRGRLARASRDPVLERSLRRQLLGLESELRKTYESGGLSPAAGSVDCTHVLHSVESEVERLIALSAAQVNSYLLSVQGLNLIDREELKVQRGFQHQALTAELRHFGRRVLEHCSKSPSGQPNIIEQWQKIQDEMRIASKRGWSDLRMAIPPEHFRAVERWASTLMGEEGKK